jgi:hypothetical protein
VFPSIALSAVLNSGFCTVDWNAGKFDCINSMVPVGEALGALDKVGPEVGPDVGPEVGPDVGPEVGPDVGPLVGPDVGPEVGPKVGPPVGSVRNVEIEKEC